MPNHIRNQVIFKGQFGKIKAILEHIQDSELGLGTIDFEKLIPMPERIRNDPGDAWYWWSVEHWGTKWNAYSQFPFKPNYLIEMGLSNQDETSIKIEFETAWRAPFKVMEALAKFDPSLTIIHYYADEDIGYNCGKAMYVNGECIEDVCYHGGIAGTEYACKVWGGTPADFHLGLNKDKTDYEYKEELDV